MVNTIKVEPIDTGDETLSGPVPLEASSDQKENHGSNLEAGHVEIQQENPEAVSEANLKQESETPSRTKQLILLGIVIFNAIVSFSLIITLPIVLTDSSDSSEIDEAVSTPSMTTKLTTPAFESAVLVLSTYSGSNTPFIVDFNGMYSIEIISYNRCLGNTVDPRRFEYGTGTKVEMGCGATIYDEFWYFGGDSLSTYRQVS